MSSQANQTATTPLSPAVAPREHSFPSSFARCPLGHVTHESLACDPRSSCWSEDDGATQVMGFPWRGRCQSERSHPAAFTCADGVTHVPYSLVCDHRDDCVDGSEEAFCTFPACQGQSPLQCGASPQVQQRSRGWGGGGFLDGLSFFRLLSLVGVEGDEGAGGGGGRQTDRDRDRQTDRQTD